MDEEPESEKIEVELFCFHMFSAAYQQILHQKIYFMLVKQNHVGKSLHKLLAT